MTMDQPFPQEIIQNILQYYPEGKLMLNKYFTAQELERKYNIIDLAEKRKILEYSSIFPYCNYVEEILIDLDQDFRSLKLKKFANVKRLLLDGSTDKYTQMERIAKEMPNIECIHCFTIELDNFTIPFHAFTNLTTLAIKSPSKSLKALKDYPKITSLMIANTVQGPVSLYASLPVLEHIKVLIIDHHRYNDILECTRVFPNVDDLSVTGHRDPVPHDFGLFKKLKTFKCIGLFDIPETVQSFTSITLGTQKIVIPPKGRQFKNVTFFFHSFDENHDNMFYRAMDYLKSVEFPVTIEFVEKLTFSNVQIPPFKNYFYKNLDGVHIYAKSIRSKVMVQDILKMDFLCDFTEGFFDKIDWTSKKVYKEMKSRLKLNNEEQEFEAFFDKVLASDLHMIKKEIMYKLQDGNANEVVAIVKELQLMMEMENIEDINDLNKFF